MGSCPERESALREVAFDRQLAAFGLLAHSLTQLFSFVGVAALSWEWYQRVGSMVFVAVGWLWPTLYPVAYLKCRKQYLVAKRALYFAFPLLRSNSGIQRILDSQPLPGLCGLAGDLFKIAWGKRPCTTCSEPWSAACHPAAPPCLFPARCCPPSQAVAWLPSC